MSGWVLVAFALGTVYGGLLAWWVGRSDAEYVRYWYEDSCRWMERYFDLKRRS